MFVAYFCAPSSEESRLCLNVIYIIKGCSQQDSVHSDMRISIHEDSIWCNQIIGRRDTIYAEASTIWRTVKRPQVKKMCNWQAMTEKSDKNYVDANYLLYCTFLHDY
jgi:hypothetical protein